MSLMRHIASLHDLSDLNVTYFPSQIPWSPVVAIFPALQELDITVTHFSMLFELMRALTSPSLHTIALRSKHRGPPRELVQLSNVIADGPSGRAVREFLLFKTGGRMLVDDTTSTGTTEELADFLTPFWRTPATLVRCDYRFSLDEDTAERVIAQAPAHVEEVKVDASPVLSLPTFLRVYRRVGIMRTVLNLDTLQEHIAASHNKQEERLPRDVISVACTNIHINAIEVVQAIRKIFPTLRRCSWAGGYSLDERVLFMRLKSAGKDEDLAFS